MKATTAYVAKRALFARLEQRAATDDGNALHGVQVLYAWNAGLAEAVCVYGGGAVGDWPEDERMEYGAGGEVVTIGVHVRVRIEPTPADGIAESDAVVEAIADEISDTIAADPHMAGRLTELRIAGGLFDYSPDEAGATSTAALRVECRAINT